MADELRGWARGMYPLEAAAELLVRGMHGRFALPGYPWIKRDTGVRGSLEPRYWADLSDVRHTMKLRENWPKAITETVAVFGAASLSRHGLGWWMYPIALVCS